MDDYRSKLLDLIDDGLGMYDMMQEGLAWFRKYHPKAFMILLD